MPLINTYGSVFAYGDGLYKGEVEESGAMLSGLSTLSSKVCYRLGLEPEHGGGWSIRSGDDWIWPDGAPSILTLFVGDIRLEMVWDSSDGLPYYIDPRNTPSTIGIDRVFKDKVDPNINGSGTDINWEILPGEIVAEMEHYFVEFEELHLSLRPYDKTFRNSDGYDANGFPTTFEVSVDILKNGETVESVEARDVPYQNDITVERHVVGNTIQNKISGIGTAFKLRTIESYHKVADRPNTSTLMTEVNLQSQSSLPQRWFTRDSIISGGLIDRAWGVLYPISATEITGPEGGRSGIADVYFIGSTTRGHIARGFITGDAGYVTGQALSEAVPSAPFATDKHFYEIGHVLESRTGAGLAKCVLHFN